MRHLAIVVGHTARQPGAHAKKPLGMSEYDYASDIAKIAHGMSGIHCLRVGIFFRDDVGIKGCYEAVNRWVMGKERDSGCVELHFNAHQVSQVRGTLTIYGNTASNGFSTFIHKGLVTLLQRPKHYDLGNRMIVGGVADPIVGNPKVFLNVNLANCPSCLIEPFFGSNEDDARLGQLHKASIAESLLVSANRFFDIY